MQESVDDVLAEMVVHHWPDGEPAPLEKFYTQQDMDQYAALIRAALERERTADHWYVLYRKICESYDDLYRKHAALVKVVREVADSLDGDDQNWHPLAVRLREAVEGE